jgi:hypothetical protein
VTRVKSKLIKSAMIAAMAAGTVIATASVASADVACNRFGECWRVRDHYTNYPSNLGVVFHDEAWWAGHPHGRWHMRADRQDDHGYYNHGAWRAF